MNFIDDQGEVVPLKIAGYLAIVDRHRSVDSPGHFLSEMLSMARRKNAPDAIRVKNGLSERLRVLRTEFYGERGGPDQARTLGIPVRTWYNYENGVTVPAEIILRVVELTAVEPIWLLRGEGPKFRNPSKSAGSGSDCLAGTPVKDLLRVAIERLEQEEQSSMDFALGLPLVTRLDDETSDFDPSSPTSSGLGRLAIRAHFSEPISADAMGTEKNEPRRAIKTLRIEDDAMAPIVAQGAHVTYGEPEPISEAFHEKMVVALIEGKPVVRWFQHCGKFGLLRSENAAANPPSILVELEPDTDRSPQMLHRVLWISTPH